MKVYTINAFAKMKNGGNPAGVVINADKLSENQMKKIAKDIGFSETAFVMKSNNADFKLRFFTPNKEVDLCGHATIATFSVLINENYIKPGIYTQETKAGILEVEVKEDKSIMMIQKNPCYGKVIDYKEIAESLNIDISDFNNKLPCQIVSTGIQDIIVPIKDIKTLDSIEPDFELVEKVSEKYNVTGYHLFAIDSSRKSESYCRNFAPLYGINEESATGTSSGALASYLYKYNKLNIKKINNIIFEQGFKMNRPSEILVSLCINKNSISKVEVGGKALKICLEKKYNMEFVNKL